MNEKQRRRLRNVLRQQIGSEVTVYPVNDRGRRAMKAGVCGKLEAIVEGETCLYVKIVVGNVLHILKVA